MNERYERAVRRVEDAKRRKAEAEGAMKQVTSQLKEEHGCNSLKAANELLSEMEKSVEQLEESFERDLKKFEEKWG